MFRLHDSWKANWLYSFGLTCWCFMKKSTGKTLNSGLNLYGFKQWIWRKVSQKASWSSQFKQGRKSIHTSFYWPSFELIFFVAVCIEAKYVYAVVRENIEYNARLIGKLRMVNISLIFVPPECLGKRKYSELIIVVKIIFPVKIFEPRLSLSFVSLRALIYE